MAHAQRKISVLIDFPGIVDGYGNNIGRWRIFAQNFQAAFGKFVGNSRFATGAFGENNRRTIFFFDLFCQGFYHRNGLFGIAPVNKNIIIVAQIIGNPRNAFAQFFFGHESHFKPSQIPDNSSRIQQTLMISHKNYRDVFGD